MQADVRLGQIRSGQMKKDPPRSESDPLKVHISEIITALRLCSLYLSPNSSTSLNLSLFSLGLTQPLNLT